MRDLVTSADELVNAIHVAENKQVNKNKDSYEGMKEELLGNVNNSNSQSTKVGKAYLNPVHDGRYGMVCMPSHAPPSILKGVRWSSIITNSFIST